MQALKRYFKNYYFNACGLFETDDAFKLFQEVTSQILHSNFTEDFTENDEKVLSLIKSNNGITTGEIASKIGLSRRAVQNIINLFKSKGILIRVGSDRRCYWQIVEK